MPEYRLNIVFRQSLGRDGIEGHMERLLDAFSETHPEVGAVIGANFHLRTMDATFSLPALDANAASSLGVSVLGDAWAASGLESTEIVEINVQVVNAVEELSGGELLPV
jgi:hypothetical protein